LSQPPHPLLIPPRPNLGPEPWPETSSITIKLVEFGLLLICLGIVAFWGIRRRRMKRGRQHPTRPPAAAPDDSPEAQVLYLAGQVRDTLNARYGPCTRARTTEEICADSQLREAIGGRHMDQLTRLLQTADRLKFAPHSEDEYKDNLLNDLSTWDVWLKSFLREIPVKT
jgi:hypothetical protein